MRVTHFTEISPEKADDVSNAGGADRLLGLGWRRAWVGLAFAAVFSCFAQDRPATSAAAGGTGTASQAPVSVATDAKPQSAETAKPSNQPTAAAAEDERKKQISDQSTQLLAMAVALKAEVDKTSKDTLSLNVIRKADAIEKLAKTVKDKMKQSGPG